MGFNYEGPICHLPSLERISSIEARDLIVDEFIKPGPEELAAPRVPHQPAAGREELGRALEARASLAEKFHVPQWSQMPLLGFDAP